VFVLRVVKGISSIETAASLGGARENRATRMYRAQRRLAPEMARRVRVATRLPRVTPERPIASSSAYWRSCLTLDLTIRPRLLKRTRSPAALPSSDWASGAISSRVRGRRPLRLADQLERLNGVAAELQVTRHAETHPVRGRRRPTTRALARRTLQ